MIKNFEQQLMSEMEILVELLENSNDNSQQKSIRNMLCDIIKYLNHRH